MSQYIVYSARGSSSGASGVTSLNGQTGALTLVAGSNITITPGAGTLTIDASASSALTTNHIFVGNGSNIATDVAMSGDATIVASGALTIANSAITNAKMANMADNTVKGNKSGGSAAPSDLALSDVVEATSAILTITNGSKAIIGAANLSIEVQQSSSTDDGYLSSTDWNTFNSKFNLPALTAGSVIFSDGSTLAEDNANFFYDDASNSLGIRTDAPGFALDVAGDAHVANDISLDSAIDIAQIATPANPASGRDKLYVKSDDKLYILNSAGSEVLVGPTTPVQDYIVNLFTLSGTDITNGYVTLTSTPVDATKVILNIIGGPVQEYGVDYQMIGADLDWNGLFLDGVLIAGDKLIVQFS